MASALLLPCFPTAGVMTRAASCTAGSDMMDCVPSNCEPSKLFLELFLSVQSRYDKPGHLVSLQSWFVGGMQKSLEFQARKTLEQPSRSLENSNSERTVGGGDPAHELSEKNKDSIWNLHRGHLSYSSAKNSVVFCAYPESLIGVKLKSNKLVDGRNTKQDRICDMVIAHSSYPGLQ